MIKLAIAWSLCLALTLLAAPAWSLMTLGIHGGFDFNSQDPLNLSDLELPNGDALSIDREELGGPLLGGVHVFVDITPIVDLEFGLEGSTTTYRVDIDHRPTAGELASFGDDLRFWRLSAYGSAKLGVLELPMTKGYIGGGLGYHWMSQLISRELLETAIVEGGKSDLDPRDLVERQGAAGIHLLLGARMDPLGLPFAVSAEYRYTMIGENDYGDETNSFGSLVVGIEFGY